MKEKIKKSYMILKEDDEFIKSMSKDGLKTWAVIHELVKFYKQNKVNPNVLSIANEITEKYSDTFQKLAK